MMRRRLIRLLVVPLVLILVSLLPAGVLAETPWPGPSAYLRLTSVDYQTLKIEWDAVTNADGYRIKHSTDNVTFSVLATTASTSFTHSGLKTDSLHCYQITPYMDVHDHRMYGTTIATAGRPRLGIPQNLTTQSAGYRSILVRWRSVTGAHGYELQRATVSTGPWTILDNRIDGTDYTDSSCTTGTVYYYRVRAWRDLGSSQLARSEFSPTAKGRAVPSAPKISSIENSSLTSIHLHWTSVAGATGYQIQTALSASGPWTLVPKSIFTTSSTVGDLTPGKTYYFQVRAYASTKTGMVNGEWSGTSSLVALPPPPGFIIATATDSQKVTLVWSTGAVGTTFLLDRANTAQGVWITIKETSANGWVDSGLVQGQIYYYRVRSKVVHSNTIYVGQPCNPIPGTPLPDAPGAFVVSPSGADSLTLSWSAVTYADGYQVQRRKASDTEWTLLEDSGTLTSMTDRPLVTGTKYVYQVRVYVQVGDKKVVSGWSSERSGTPVRAADPTATTAADPTPTTPASTSPTSPAEPSATAAPTADASAPATPTTAASAAPTEDPIPGDGDERGLPWYLPVGLAAITTALAFGAAWVLTRRNRRKQPKEPDARG